MKNHGLIKFNVRIKQAPNDPASGKNKKLSSLIDVYDRNINMNMTDLHV